MVIDHVGGLNVELIDTDRRAGWLDLPL